MSNITVDISISLDGYVAGPDPSMEEPLGKGGELLHEWAFALRAWQQAHGGEGGENSELSRLVEARLARTGAVIMGRRMFSGGAGPWEGDPKARGWWGDDPPFGVPVYVLTHHAREPLEMHGGTTFHFVTDGPEAALERARAAAGDRDIQIAGGADAIRQYLAMGVVDELEVHVAPVLLGAGTPLFGPLDGTPRSLETTRVLESDGVAHIHYACSDGT